MLHALIIFGIAQAVLLAFVLATTRRGYEPANRLLAALMLTIGVQITLSQIGRSDLILRLPHLIRLHHPLDFIAGPLLYLYIRTLVSRQPLQRSDLLHFLPAMFCVAYLLPYYLQSSAYKLDDLNSAAYAKWYYVRSGLAIAIGAGYVVVAARFAVLNRSRDPRMQFVCGAFLAVLVVAAARYVIDFLAPSSMPVTNWFLPVMGAGILYGMTYLGLRDPKSAEANFRKYESSSLTPERAERGLQLLLRALDHDKAFLDPDITLNNLANRLGIPAAHLSQIVNERLNKTFYFPST